MHKRKVCEKRCVEFVNKGLVVISVSVSVTPRNAHILIMLFDTQELLERLLISLMHEEE